MSSRIKSAALALLAFAGITLLGGLAGQLVFAGLNGTQSVDSVIHLGAAPIASLPSQAATPADWPSTPTAPAPAFSVARRDMFLGAPRWDAGGFQPWGWAGAPGASFDCGYEDWGWSGRRSGWAAHDGTCGWKA